MKLHMDGARLANAIAHLGCTPAEADMARGRRRALFGATKNGALGAEAVVSSIPNKCATSNSAARNPAIFCPRCASSPRSSFCALEENRWLAWAARANAFAGRLARGLAEIGSIEIVHPVQASMIFAFMPDAMVARLRAQGASFYEWAPSDGRRTLVRLVTSFMTPRATSSG